MDLTSKSKNYIFEDIINEVPGKYGQLYSMKNKDVIAVLTSRTETIKNDGGKITTKIIFSRSDVPKKNLLNPVFFKNFQKQQETVSKQVKSLLKFTEAEHKKTLMRNIKGDYLIPQSALKGKYVPSNDSNGLKLANISLDLSQAYNELDTLKLLAKNPAPLKNSKQESTDFSTEISNKQKEIKNLEQDIFAISRTIDSEKMQSNISVDYICANRFIEEIINGKNLIEAVSPLPKTPPQDTKVLSHDTVSENSKTEENDGRKADTDILNDPSLSPISSDSSHLQSLNDKEKYQIPPQPTLAATFAGAASQHPIAKKALEAQDNNRPMTTNRSVDPAKISSPRPQSANPPLNPAPQPQIASSAPPNRVPPPPAAKPIPGSALQQPIAGSAPPNYAPPPPPPPQSAKAVPSPALPSPPAPLAPKNLQPPGPPNRPLPRIPSTSITGGPTPKPDGNGIKGSR